LNACLQPTSEGIGIGKVQPQEDLLAILETHRISRAARDIRSSEILSMNPCDLAETAALQSAAELPKTKTAFIAGEL